MPVAVGRVTERVKIVRACHLPGYSGLGWLILQCQLLASKWRQRVFPMGGLGLFFSPANWYKCQVGLLPVSIPQTMGEGLAMLSSHSASAPVDPHLELHQRLVDRDPNAPADLAVTFLEPLIAWLSERNPRIHPDHVNEAADEAIVALIRNPASYSPSKCNLESYLRMSAQGDLRNLLAKERRHRRNYPLLDVELSQDDGKYPGREVEPPVLLMFEEEQARRRDGGPDPVRDGLTEVDRRCLELMESGERKTARFAEILGITDRPIEEQKLLVKRIKDRLKKRIERRGPT